MFGYGIVAVYIGNKIKICAIISCRPPNRLVADVRFIAACAVYGGNCNTHGYKSVKQKETELKIFHYRPSFRGDRLKYAVQRNIQLFIGLKETIGTAE
jgi:hypothetical protein